MIAYTSLVRGFLILRKRMVPLAQSPMCRALSVTLVIFIF